MLESHPVPQKIIQQSFRTGNLTVIPRQNRIELDGSERVLQPKVMQLLQILCSAEGQTLSKKVLIELLWPDVQVGDDSLANTMARLRRALNEQSKQPQFIETVQRRGYRWLLPVQVNAEQDRSKKLLFFAAATVLITIGLIGTYWLTITEPKKFPFKEMSIESTQKGFEVSVGVEGELNDAKINQVKAEVGRIVGEDYSKMEVVVDEKREECSTQHNPDEDTKQKTKSSDSNGAAATDC